jgi:hypothetical protein
MLQSTHINIHYAFYDTPGRESTYTHIPPQDWKAGIDRICRTLSAVPIARNVGISWTDATDGGSSTITRGYFQPLATFPMN